MTYTLIYHNEVLMKKSALILLIASLYISCIPSQVRAEVDGNMLLNNCVEAIKYIDNINDPSINSASENFCAGYISGVNELHATFVSSVACFDPPVFCNPSHDNLNKLVKITVNYLKMHPDDLHYNGSVLILSALKEAFPCSNNTPE